MTDITPLLVELEQLLAKATDEWFVAEGGVCTRGRPEDGGNVICLEPERLMAASLAKWPERSALIVAMKSALPTLITAYRAERMRADAAEAALGNTNIPTTIDEVETALENLLNAAERHIFGDECKAERRAALDALALAKRRRGLREMVRLDEELGLYEPQQQGNAIAQEIRALNPDRRAG